MIKLTRLFEAIEQPETITLYYQEGNSDKVYNAILRPEGNGWVVDAQWGRRGATMQTGTKTNSPESYQVAKKIYDKLVQSKMAKGYTPGKSMLSPGTKISSAPVSTTAKIPSTSKKVAEPEIQAAVETPKTDTGTYPQLLNPISEDELEAYMKDDSYGAQEKYDGKRIIIDATGNSIRGINRKGIQVALPLEIESDMKQFSGEMIDGELVKNIYYVFDLLKHNNQAIYTLPYKSRYDTLSKLKFSGNIKLTPLAIGEAQKRKLYDMLQRHKKEGIVFKKLSAHYTAGRPVTGGTQLKYKFWESCSAVVDKINAKRSIGVKLLDENKRWINVGNVTVPPNYDMPNVGDVVEIKYLYVVRKGGSLYQPQYLGVRDDIEPEACTTKQLKYKE